MPKLIGINNAPEQILRNISNRLQNQVHNNIWNTYLDQNRQTAYSRWDLGNADMYRTNNQGHVVPNTEIGWPDGLREYIHRCVLHACAEILDNLYTEEDFERDLNLK